MASRSQNFFAEEDDRSFITALARGLDVLSAFKRGEEFLGNTEIAERCGLPKSTVSRLTHTLTRRGYLTYSEAHGKYRHGPALMGLASVVLGGLNIRELARERLQDLASFANASAGLGVRDRLSMRYVECCHGRATILLNVEIGTRMSLSRSAMGRAYLAVCDSRERDELMDEIRAIDESAWPRLRAGIEKGLRDYEEYGCATAFGDWQEKVSGIAVGFHPGGGLPPMVLNCGAPTVMTPPDFLLSAVRPRLIDIARSLTGRVDGR